MARAAVRAKQRAAKQAQPAPKARRGGRRRHASGGNPNQELFFVRMRRSAKPVYVVLAVLFAITFAFLGIGSGTSGGLDQLFNNLNLFKKDGASLSAAQDAVKKHPTDPNALRKLATAYTAKGDTASAITTLQQLTAIRAKDAAAWEQLAALQLAQAQSYASQYSSAYQAQQLAAPSQAFRPGGTLGAALGTNPIESAAASAVNATTTDLYSKALMGYTDAVGSYKQVARLRPRDANAQFQLAQAAQTAGDRKTAAAAYRAYLKLNPGTTSAAQIRQLIKQLTAAPTPPPTAKKPHK